MDPHEAPQAPPVVSVMVVDDHGLIREGLCAALRAAGMNVVGAFGEPDPAVECASRRRVNVAIIDLLLDRQQEAAKGLALIGCLRALEAPPALLVLSGVASSLPLLSEAYRAGADAYLDKAEVGADEVVEAVRALAGLPTGAAKPRLPPPGGSLLERAGVSPRELQVLAYVGAAADNLQISAFLEISERTVKAHMGALYRKLGKDHRTELALVALEHGLRPQRA